MRSKRFKLLASLVAAVFLFSSVSLAGAQEEQEEKEERTSLDLADLNLEVVETEVVEEITDEEGNTLTAEEGRKLVIVTLEGEAREAGTINPLPEGFTAVNHDDAEGEDPSFRNFPSAAVTTDDTWVFGPSSIDQERVATEAETIDEPGTVTIKVAFAVDEDITEFDVLVPTETNGTSIVPEDSTPEEDSTEDSTPEEDSTEESIPEE